MTGFVGGVILLAGVAQLGVGRWLWRSAARLAQRRQQCRPASGVVVQLAPDPPNSLVPMVAYFDADGVEHTAPAVPISPGDWPRLGDLVELHYDPADPDWIMLEGQPEKPLASRLAVASFALGAVLVIAGCAILVG